MTRAIAVGLVILALVGCQAKTDLGLTCRMTKPKAGSCTSGDPAAICPVPILASELIDPTLDYVALGSSECDDLVCVRTAGSANPDAICPADKPTCADSEKIAQGYCTSGCLDESNCTPDYQGNSGTLKCSQLLLSDAFLANLKATDPTTYEAMFGSGASANYCIKPRAAK